VLNTLNGLGCSIRYDKIFDFGKKFHVKCVAITFLLLELNASKKWISPEETAQEIITV